MTPSRRTRIGIASALAAVLGVGLGAVGGLWYALEHPWVLCRGAEWALDWPEESLQLEVLDWTMDGTFELHGLRIQPPMPTAPIVAIERASGSLPNPWDVSRHRVVDLGDVEIEGVEIEQRQRRAPSERPPPPARPLALVARAVAVHRGSYVALPDPPFKQVVVSGVSGNVGGFRWVPAARSFEGVGRVRADEMVLGSLEVSEIVVPWLVLADGNLMLANSSFLYGRTEGSCEGTVSNLAGRPGVEIDVRLEDSRIETAIEDAMDRASPVMGWLSAELTIIAGGELPRGDAHFDGWVSLTDAYVFVGDDLKLIPKILLDVAPWFSRDGGGWLSVGDLYGEASFGRGWVELERMERVSKKHRILQAWGSLRDGAVDLTVRAVPKKPHKGGVGVRVRGPLRSTQIRLAKKDELQQHPEILVVD